MITVQIKEEGEHQDVQARVVVEDGICDQGCPNGILYISPPDVSNAGAGTIARVSGKH